VTKVSIVIRVTYDDVDVAKSDSNEPELVAGIRVDHGVLFDKDSFYGCVLSGAETLFSKLKNGNRQEASNPV